jgi:hypothetical protein
VNGASGWITRGEQDSALVDVANVPLTHLVNAHGDSPVTRAVKRLQTDLKDPNGVLSAFGSFIDKS